MIHLKKILNFYPEETIAQYRLGLIFSDDNKFIDAIHSFKSVIEKEPKHTGALFSLALVYEKRGDSIQAKNVYGNILETDPEYAEVYVRLGSLYLREANYVKAKECFVNTLKLNKYPAEAYLALSKISLSMNDFEECVKSCNELLKYLSLPRNVLIDSVTDLSNLYIKIGTHFKKQKVETLANYSFEIADILSPLTPEKNVVPGKE